MPAAAALCLLCLLAVCPCFESMAMNMLRLDSMTKNIKLRINLPAKGGGVAGDLAPNNCPQSSFACIDGECLADETLCDPEYRCKTYSDDIIGSCIDVPSIIMPRTGKVYVEVSRFVDEYFGIVFSLCRSPQQDACSVVRVLDWMNSTLALKYTTHKDCQKWGKGNLRCVIDKRKDLSGPRSHLRGYLKFEVKLDNNKLNLRLFGAPDSEAIVVPIPAGTEHELRVRSALLITDTRMPITFRDESGTRLVAIVRTP